VKLSISIKYLYGIAFSFIVLSIIGLVLDFPWIAVLPLVVFGGWVFVTKPKYILYFLAFSTPLSIHLVEERISSINLSLPTEPLIIALFVVVLLKMLKSKSLKMPEVQTLLSILIITDFSWLLFTSFTSTMPLISAKYVLAKSWYLIVFYFLLARVFQNQKNARIFIWCFISSVIILSTYTLYVHAGGGFSRDYAYTAMRPFLPDHGMYAACISFAVPALFVFSVYGKSFNYSAFVRILSFVLFLFLILAVALSFTRAAWLSLVVAFGVYALLLLKIKFRYVVMLALLAVGVLFSNLDDLLTDLSRNKNESDDNIENHLQSVSNVSSDPSNLERLNRWGCGVRMWEDKPIVGFGPGTYTFQYGQYQLPHQMTIISTNAGTLGGVHSEYIRPLAESGTFGALSWVAIVLSVFALGFKQNRQLSGSAKYLSLAVFLGLITYFVHSVLNNYSEFDKIAVPLYSFMAVLTAIELNTINDKKNSSK
jgi:putative inorganic carbon (HCO3(-)) transporter